MKRKWKIKSRKNNFTENGLAQTHGADLGHSHLGDANFSGADLSRANLSRANMGGVNFSGATLSDSIILAPVNYGELILDKETRFDNAVMDDPDFILYIQKSGINIPQQKINNKRELKEKLEQLGLKEKVSHYIKLSKLPN